MGTDGETRGRQTGRCPHLCRATDILGKKWHPVVIDTLLVEGALGFKELKTALDGVSDKVLSDSLDDLQEAGVVTRDVIADKPVRVEYSLTGAGRKLEPVVVGLRTWGREHLDGTG